MMSSSARCLLTAALSLALTTCSQTKESEETAPDAPATADVPATPGKSGGTPTPAKPTTSAMPGTAAVSTPKPFEPKAPGVRVSHVAVPGPYVALTFDDGPHGTYTPQILDILKRHGAHATFFVLGSNASRNPGILARAVAEGNEIGSHTWNHMNMAHNGDAAICGDLDRTAAAIEKATGKRPRVMRPPYGSADSRVTSLVYNRYGTPAILWDVDTEDWRHPGVGVVIDRAVGRAKPGSIILVHDIHASTLAAVEGIVTGLQARGYTLVTVSQLMAMGRRAAGVAEPAAPDAPAASADAAPAPAEPASEPIPTAPLPEAGAGAASIGTAPATEPSAEGEPEL